MILTPEQLSRWNENRVESGKVPLDAVLANELLWRLDEQTRRELMERIIR